MSTPAASPAGDDPLDTLRVMLDSLSVQGLWELERALTGRLHPVRTAAQERVAELGFLAALLDRCLGPRNSKQASEDSRSTTPTGSSNRPRVIARAKYDELRGGDAPRSALLVDRYGSWRKACRAADGLLQDGRSTGPGKPWRSGRGPAADTQYTDEEIMRCVRACAVALLRRPSSTDYYHWRRAGRAYLQRVGSTERLATVDVVISCFGSWPAAVAAAAISDADLTAWAARRIPADPTAELADGARAAFAGLPLAALDAIGIGQQRRGSLLEDGFGSLPLSDAARLAHHLDGSLEWLAEQSRERGLACPAAARFDGAKFSALRRARQIPEGQVRQRLRLPLGPYRQILSGRREPTLAQLLIGSSLLGVEAGELLRSR
jgi:hypothetical protein